MQSSSESELLVVEPAVGREAVIDFLDVLLILTHRRKVLLGTVALTFVLSLVASLLLPQYYEARTSILPPQSSSTSANMMAGQMAALTGISTRELGIKSQNDLYVGLLGSESVANALIARFRLQESYGVSRLTDARKKLMRFSNINSGKDGLITITVEDRSPDRAAALANGFAEELEQLGQRLAISEAGQRRLFFEQQLKKVKLDLNSAELALGETQKRTGVIEPEGNAKALVEGGALLRAQLAAKEVEVQSMRTFATASNPDLRLAEQQAAALRAQLAKLEVGTGEGISGSAGKLSGAAVEYAGRFREVKYQEALFELLAKQYEMARLDEAREGSPVQIVDRATPPERHSRPRRTLIVAASTLLVGLLVFAAVLMEGSARQAMADPSRSVKLMELKDSWRVKRW